MRLSEPSKVLIRHGNEKQLIDPNVTINASSDLWGGLRGIWSKATCDESAECRNFFFASDLSQVRPIVFVLAFAIAAFAISDYLFFSFSPLFVALIALRIGLIASCIAYLMRIEKAKNYRPYDHLTLTLLLVIVAGILLVNTTRPTNFLPHIIVIDVAIFVFYLVIPTRFIFQALPSLLFSVGEVVIIMFTFQWFMAAGLTTAVLSLIFANLVAALASLQMHSYRSQIFQNITERKETDRLAAIGQTAGMIGHDIRNPLQAITNELYIAKESIAESPVPPEITMSAIESIELIEEQTNYISKIVSDLQDYSRPIKPEYTETDISKMLVSIFHVIRLPENINLKVNVTGFPMFSTDQTLLRRALTNLVNNAIQAMPEGGTLRLAAHKTANTIVIAVSDTGKGIPDEIKQLLFTPLMTTKAKGQGLGLVVVKRFVEALGGTVTFESQPSQGTTFTITLPIYS